MTIRRSTRSGKSSSSSAITPSKEAPSFKTQIETFIDVPTGQVSARYLDRGKQKYLHQSLRLPADLSNGLLYTIVKNIAPSSTMAVSYLAFTPKPRLVKLVFTRAGKERFLAGATSHEAIRYTMKVEIGGITGLVASLLGKIPPDCQFWLLDGSTPAFAAFEGPLDGTGPIWRIGLVSPTPPAESARASR